MLPSPKDMLRQMVATRSISSLDVGKDESNLAMIELLENWARNIGFETKIIPVDEKKANLIASYGSGEGGLVLSGHTDTVPFDEKGWHSDPFEMVEKEGKFFGLGTCDMKGFFAAALHAFQSVRKKQLIKPLYLLATADEESSMSGVRRLVELGIPEAKYAVIGEPTGMIPVHMHKGIMMESAEVFGKAAHSSQPHLGINAIDGAIQVMNILSETSEKWKRNLPVSWLGKEKNQIEEKNNSWRDFELPYPTLNVGVVRGGDSVNRVCSHCSIAWDIRLMPGMDFEILTNQFRSKIREAVEKKYHLSFHSMVDPIPPFYQTKTAFVQSVERISGALSKSVTFCTEAPFLSQMGMEVLILGPGDIEVAYQPNEYVEISELEKAESIFQELIEQICIKDEL